MRDQTGILAVNCAWAPRSGQTCETFERDNLAFGSDDRQAFQFVNVLTEMPLIADADGIAFSPFDR